MTANATITVSIIPAAERAHVLAGALDVLGAIPGAVTLDAPGAALALDLGAVATCEDREVPAPTAEDPRRTRTATAEATAWGALRSRLASAGLPAVQALAAEARGDRAAGVKGDPLARAILRRAGVKAREALAAGEAVAFPLASGDWLAAVPSSVKPAASARVLGAGRERVAEAEAARARLGTAARRMLAA